MDSKTLSEAALKTVESYLHFSNGNADVSIPYFNNRRSHVHHGLRSLIGKGSINDIREEIQLIAFREKRDLSKASASDFKKYLVDHNIGIDCSGFAYYVLDSEGKTVYNSSLRSRISYPFRGLVGKLISRFRPAENINVRALADNKNSSVIPLPQVKPGDFITMMYTNDNKHNHVILIHKVDYENTLPKTLYYSHSMSWPTDGEYNHGVRQGKINVTNANNSIIEQEWIEDNTSGESNYTFFRAKNADVTEIRRLNWFR